MITIELRPSVTKSNDKKEHNISDHMVSNKICTRHHELSRCIRLCNQDTAHVTSTKITDKQPNGGKDKLITELPREDKNKHYLVLIKIKKYVCVILDAYNNNIRIHIEKLDSHTTAGLRNRGAESKQTKKIKGQKDVLAWELDEERGATRYTTPPLKHAQPAKTCERAEEDIVVYLGLVFQASKR